MLEELSGRVGKLIEGKEPIGFTVKFEIEGQGVIYVDGNASPMLVTNVAAEADTTFIINRENLLSLLGGDLSAMMAYMQGKLVVKGDIAKAMSLASLFS